MRGKSVLLSRMMQQQTITVEAFTGVDGQGKPSYGSAKTTEAVVRAQASVVTTAEGSQLGTDMTLWFRADAPVFAEEQDRVTVDGMKYIAVEVKDVENFGSVRIHRRVKCQVE